MSTPQPEKAGPPGAAETNGTPGLPVTVRECDKPWGGFEQYTHNLPCTVKIITVAPGGTLSRQYHDHRDELWVVLDAGALAELGDAALRPDPGERLFIPRETVHRLAATGNGPVRILEISFGEFDEDDIVRLEDAYGRAGSAERREGPSRAPTDDRLRGAVGV